MSAQLCVAWPRKAQEHQTPPATPAPQQQSHVCATGSTHGEAAAPAAGQPGQRGAGHRGLLTPQSAPQEEEGKDSATSAEHELLRVFYDTVSPCFIRANFSPVTEHGAHGLFIHKLTHKNYCRVEFSPLTCLHDQKIRLNFLLNSEMN